MASERGMGLHNQLLWERPVLDHVPMIWNQLSASWPGHDSVGIKPGMTPHMIRTLETMY
jgi:hypothetical protein